MSQAIAQSATVLSKSPTVGGEAEYPFTERIVTIASRKSGSGITLERLTLNRQSLIDSLRVDYRSHFAAIYGKSERLPSDINDKIELTVTEFITAQLTRVNPVNVIGFRRAFHWKEKDSSVTERLTTTGENSLPLQVQHHGITAFIVAAEKRLKDLQAKVTPDYEMEKEIQNRIVRLNNTKAFIEREIQHQQELAKAK